MVRRRRFREFEEAGTGHDLEALHEHARPLRQPADLDPLLERIGDARYVLLGEASHGTAEYYTWRFHLSRRLILERGFSFIAVEGDWPDCYRVNRYVKELVPSAGDNARQVLHAFERWPTWMWANEEIAVLAEWLREHNGGLAEDRRVGFYGLDVYSLWDSLHSVLEHLSRSNPAALSAARKAFHCFEPYHEDAEEYARATRWVEESCEDEVIGLLAALRQTPFHDDGSRESHFNAEQNALVVKNAEHYYRTMVRGGPDSWNVRDRHMVETLERLMHFHGAGGKAIVWEHNTHIGDARFTDMAEDGMINVGQLVREGHADEGVVLVGFGSHRGTVIAGDEWGAPMRRMLVPPALHGSWEDLLHQVGKDDKLLVFGDRDRNGPLAVPRGHRAIGVVYRPAFERYGNYVPTQLARRYDAFLYLDETKALHPLDLKAVETGEVPETYPSGV